MHKLILTFIFLITSAFAFSQTVEFVKKSDKNFKRRFKNFNYIDSTSDVNNFEFVATFKATGKNSTATIERLYSYISEKAKIWGANCFKFNSFVWVDSTNQAILVLDTYFAKDSILKKIASNYVKNTIYIFGAIRPKDKTLYSFELNKKIISIPSGTFYKIKLEPEGEIEINKGGKMGTTVWPKWQPDKPTVFLTPIDLSVISNTNRNGYSAITFSPKTGEFVPMDENFGWLLTHILKQL